jgi:hypothetical protein
LSARRRPKFRVTSANVSDVKSIGRGYAAASLSSSA